MSTLKVDTWKSSDGVNEFFKCRAWVNFDSTGVLAVRASGNVSSVVDNAVGNFGVNFSNALADASYAVVTSKEPVLTAGSGEVGSMLVSQTSAAFQLYVTANGSLVDNGNIHAAVFR
jgi:hypothetical protein